MKPIIESQYGASLAMLGDAIGRCSDALWVDDAYKHRFWRVAYHTLFFTDLYLSVSRERFEAWAKHVDELEALGPMIHKDGKLPKAGPVYAQEDVAAYCGLVIEKVHSAVDELDLEGESGFFWLPFSATRREKNRRSM